MKWKAALCGFGTVLLTNGGLASEVTGTVYDIYVHTGTNVFFRVSNAQPEECAYSNRYAIKLSDPGGEAMYAAILAARSANHEVYVKGSGTCTIHTDTEDVNYIKY